MSRLFSWLYSPQPFPRTISIRLPDFLRILADALLEAASESVDEAVKSNILPIYLAFLSSDKFFEKFNRYPGSAIDDSDDATDLIEFKTVLTSVLVSLGGSGSTSEDVENVMGEL